MDNQNGFDKFFKVALLAIAAITSFALYSSSGNQRYTFLEKNGTFFVIDTKTADVYTSTADVAIGGVISRWIKINPITGVVQK